MGQSKIMGGGRSYLLDIYSNLSFDFPAIESYGREIHYSISMTGRQTFAVLRVCQWHKGALDLADLRPPSIPWHASFSSAIHLTLEEGWLQRFLWAQHGGLHWWTSPSMDRGEDPLWLLECLLNNYVFRISTYFYISDKVQPYKTIYICPHLLLGISYLRP